MLFGCPLLERRRIVHLATLDFTTMDHLPAIPALLEHFRMEQRVRDINWPKNWTFSKINLLGHIDIVLSCFYGKFLKTHNFLISQAEEELRNIRELWDCSGLFSIAKNSFLMAFRVTHILLIGWCFGYF